MKDVVTPIETKGPLFRQSVVRAKTEVIDATAGRVRAVVSTEAKDRQGDIIRQDFWDLADFNKHPVLLSSHNYGSLRSQIGEWEDMAVVKKRLEGTAIYYIGKGNEEADWTFQLASMGKAAFSVGYIPDMNKAKELEKEPGSGSIWPNYEFRGQQLLEVSHVVVPANAQALQKLKAVGLDDPMAEIVNELLGDNARRIAGQDLMSFLLDSGVAFRSAIRPHASPKANEDVGWDAGAEVKAAEGSAQLRRMHGWVDNDDDPDSKGAYKFPHHKADGTAVWGGVGAAMAALLGARGGAVIPEGDRQGVYNHLARHYALWDKEAPDFKAKAAQTVNTSQLLEAIQKGWKGE